MCAQILSQREHRTFMSLSIDCMARTLFFNLGAASLDITSQMACCVCSGRSAHGNDSCVIDMFDPEVGFAQRRISRRLHALLAKRETTLRTRVLSSDKSVKLVFAMRTVFCSVVQAVSASGQDNSG